MTSKKGVSNRSRLGSPGTCFFILKKKKILRPFFCGMKIHFHLLAPSLDSHGKKMVQKSLGGQPCHFSPLRSVQLPAPEAWLPNDSDDDLEWRGRPEVVVPAQTGGFGKPLILKYKDRCSDVKMGIFWGAVLNYNNQKGLLGLCIETFYPLQKIKQFLWF